MLPCLFCGRIDLLGVEPRPNSGFMSVLCRVCGCIGPGGGDIAGEATAEAEVIAHWNRRPAPLVILMSGTSTTGHINEGSARVEIGADKSDPSGSDGARPMIREVSPRKDEPSATVDGGMRRVSSLHNRPLREVIRYEASFGGVICLYWTDERPTWIDFEIFEPAGIVNADCPIYYATEKRDSTVVDGITTDFDRAIWTVRGFVKVDGCTQVYFPEGPLHYDDATGFQALFAAICRAQDRCYEIMKVF
jgi:hypothetical protein